MMWLMVACGGPSERDTADSATDTARPDTAPTTHSTDSADSVPDSAAAFCADAPTLAWSNFGQGFMTENCQGGHASDAADRHDAPEEITFDTAEQCWIWADEILDSATGDDPTMPPRGGVTEDDRVRLEWWLRCGTPGT